MRKVEVNVYKYDELPPKVKEKVYEQHRSLMADDNNEQLKDEFATRLDEYGYPNTDIRWSLGYSQGDGMAFYGSVDDVPSLIRRIVPAEMIQHIPEDAWEWDAVSVSIRKVSTHYHHWNTMRVDIEVGNPPDDESVSFFTEGFVNELTKLIQDDVAKTSKELEKFGYSFIYPETEDVEEDLKTLNFEYFIDGRIYNG